MAEVPTTPTIRVVATDDERPRGFEEWAAAFDEHSREIRRLALRQFELRNEIACGEAAMKEFDAIFYARGLVFPTDIAFTEYTEHVADTPRAPRNDEERKAAIVLMRAQNPSHAQVASDVGKAAARLSGVELMLEQERDRRSLAKRWMDWHIARLIAGA